MAKKIIVIRLDPEKKNIARLVIERRPETICRMMKVRDPRRVHVMDIEKNPLHMILRDQSDIPEGQAGFKIKGYGEVRGPAILVGHHGNRACNVPVDPAWVARMIEWIS